MKNFMRLFVSSIAFLLGLTAPSFARIGETMDQAVKRYGRVLYHKTDGEEFYGFHKSGLIVMAHFADGKIDCITYAKAPNGKQKLTPTEIKTLLKANNDGRAMKELGPDGWSGDNGLLAASEQSEEGMWVLAFVRPDNNATETEKKAEEKALQGF
jgi:hypothetical protein